jgi:probable addiction module antidote protein
MAKGTKFNDHLDLELTDPDFAAAYLATALEEGDDVFLSDALSHVIKAHGVTALSTETGIARQALYKMFSSEGNPSFKNVSKLLAALGLEITVQPKNKVS